MTNKLITSIKIEKLFGLYTYSLPLKGDSLPNTTIFYGDNGVGKSTILRLVFHLLSTANNKGHRTALFNAIFDSLVVELSSGVELSARFEQQPKKRLILEIIEQGKVIAVWNYRPDSGKGSFVIETSSRDGQHIIVKQSEEDDSEYTKYDDSIAIGNESYLAVLKKYVPDLFVLNTHRNLDGDSTLMDDSDDRIAEPSRFFSAKTNSMDEKISERVKDTSLSQAMDSASKWINQKAVLSTNQGLINVHSLYVDILQRLSQSSQSEEENIDELLNKLNDIENRTAELSKYELAAPLKIEDFKIALSSGHKMVAANLLKPYILSLESRITAIDEIYPIIDRFVTMINEFFKDKTLSFKLSHGFRIHNRLEKVLIPSQLSSGEQQLLLLFCYVLTARDKPSVFMIDEPEISLNIKWKRKLIQSLLTITDNAPIQLIFASHSMELIAQHRNSVVVLVNENE